MLKSLCYLALLHSSVHLTVIWFFSSLSSRWNVAISLQLWVFLLIVLDISSWPGVNVQDLRKPILAGIAGWLSVHMPKVISCCVLGRDFLYQEQHTKSQKYFWRREKLTFLQGISYLQLRWGHSKRGPANLLFRGPPWFWHLGTHLFDSLCTTAIITHSSEGNPDMKFLPAVLKPLNFITVWMIRGHCGL